MTVFCLGWNLPRLHLNLMCITSIKTHRNGVTFGPREQKICYKSEIKFRCTIKSHNVKIISSFYTTLWNNSKKGRNERSVWASKLVMRQASSRMTHLIWLGLFSDPAQKLVELTHLKLAFSQHFWCSLFHSVVLLNLLTAFCSCCFTFIVMCALVVNLWLFVWGFSWTILFE